MTSLALTHRTHRQASARTFVTKTVNADDPLLMGSPALVLLLLLLGLILSPDHVDAPYADTPRVRMPDGQWRCPSITRPTIYGEVTLECSGRGPCNRQTGECQCKNGAEWAEWQVQPENLKPKSRNGSNCGVNAGEATAGDVTRHQFYLVVLFTLEFISCWWLFGTPLPSVVAEHFPAPPAQARRFAEQPWLLPKFAAWSACITLCATIFSSLFANADCNCYWLADFNRYQTISALAEHPPMTVITPLGVLVSTYLLTAATWLTVDRALSLPCYATRANRAAMWSWAFVAWNSAFWGLGVNVFFNESWDHDTHIDLSYFYFTFASLNNVFLLLALAPELQSVHAAHLNDSSNLFKLATVPSTAAKVAFHAAWASPLLAVVYLQVYGYKDKPHWVLGVYEHAMSFFQIICAGVSLCATMREGTEKKGSTAALLQLEHEPP